MRPSIRRVCPPARPTRRPALSLCPMLLSLRWLNDSLDPGNLTKEEAEDVLMNLGFPIETWEGDRFDLEVTSNRGDLLCHVGAAREVAAKTGRRLLSAQGAEVAE